jgi:hypothetical protein
MYGHPELCPVSFRRMCRREALYGIAEHIRLHRRFFYTAAQVPHAIAIHAVVCGFQRTRPHCGRTHIELAKTKARRVRSRTLAPDRANKTEAFEAKTTVRLNRRQPARCEPCKSIHTALHHAGAEITLLFGIPRIDGEALAGRMGAGCARA